MTDSSLREGADKENPSVSLTADSSLREGANKENLSVMASREIGHASSPCRGAKYV